MPAPPDDPYGNKMLPTVPVNGARVGGSTITETIRQAPKFDSAKGYVNEWQKNNAVASRKRF